MVSAIRIPAIAASLFVLAIGSGILKARSDQTGVTVTVEFPTPLLDPAPLAEGVASRFHVDAKITNNTGGSLRISRYRSVLPELLDAAGAVVPFDFGTNMSRLARLDDYPVLASGASLVIPVDGSMELRAAQIGWKGGDGILGYWKVMPASRPFHLRLRYSQRQSTAGPLIDDGVVSGIWTGEAVTRTAQVPLLFAR